MKHVCANLCIMAKWNSKIVHYDFLFFNISTLCSSIKLVDLSMPLETYERITYPIPSNDSVEFVYLFCILITKTIHYEQKKLAAANGKVVKEEEPKIGEIAPPFDKIKIDRINDELLVLPYEGLSPASDDPSEIKEFLEKLVVVKINDSERTKMGFDGPKSAIEISNGLTSLDLLSNYIESSPVCITEVERWCNSINNNNILAFDL
ncbi:hypothetical protein L1987_59047 [Smallanthus sonchifolius]|uniref:Uncharacterized protein n=1 Tax=Smallanthus sonchifolius TaxID=185202 RepID=A0ACB9D4D4_9ASTR|nr:hypothetical protein L1987_59047 [Smallanthus sonchifolius]